MKLFQAYDMTSMEALIREYYPRVVGYASGVVGYDEARDIAQEVFMYVWKHRFRIDVPEDGQGENALAKYMFAVCRSRIVDLLRHSRHKVVYSPEKMLRMEADLEWMDLSCSDIIKSLSDKNLLSEVMEEVRKMPESRQKVFRLRVLYGYRTADIAEILKMPLRTVEGHIYLSFKTIRENVSVE